MPDTFGPGEYVGRITSEHFNKPNYIQSVTVTFQVFADLLTTLNAMPQEFDLDGAIGAQLDAVGTRVNVTRYVDLPPPDIFFQFDTDANHGWDVGVWWGGDNGASTIERLDDTTYRQLLKAVIFSHEWDGTIPNAYKAWRMLFPQGSGPQVLIQDYGYMRMMFVLVGTDISPLQMAMFKNGYLTLKPMAVRLFYATQSAPGPVFAFDVPDGNPYLAGWDEGSWALITEAS